MFAESATRKGTSEFTKVCLLKLWKCNDCSPSTVMYLRGLRECPRCAGPKDRRGDRQHDHTPGGGHVLDHFDAPHLCVLRLVEYSKRVCVVCICAQSRQQQWGALHAAVADTAQGSPHTTDPSSCDKEGYQHGRFISQQPHWLHSHRHCPTGKQFLLHWR